ncbi:AAA family ATPase [Simiduia curdlanivorans]|uniref:AAA family ATPase n=1 Tax=Simiduia curdlanivorans TaxID=1492769 RepID=A0ABV8V571_9GAMM|nr:ExeA family protein [Simiduia curdlanivorans]MDN3640733.1 AAA family ATPase [Simiduia curdlanivorans]
MYIHHFGLNDAPFSISPNPRYLFMSQKHKEALAHLLYGVGVGGGFVLLTGEVGTGKTTICRSLLEQLPANTDVAFILNPLLDATELLESICDELSIAYIEDKTSVRKLSSALYRFLLENHSKGRNTVLLIDEAQNLHPSVLELIRLLTNLETDTKKLLQIIFIGQPELKELLNKPALRQLSQRITARFHIEPLNAEETQAYIRHRLQVAGLANSQKIFPPKLIADIHRYSGGIPRLINILCDRMLLGAYAENSRNLDTKKLKQAAAEVIVSAPETLSSKPNLWRRKSLSLLQASLGLMVLGLGTYFLSSHIHQGAVQAPLVQDAAKAIAETAESDSTMQTLATPTATIATATTQRDETDIGNSPVETSAAQAPELTLATQTYSTDSAALSALFTALGSPQLGGPAPCEDTAGTQWHCASLTVKNWKGFLQYNRPAVLEFVNQSGQSHYGVILSVQGVTATLLHQGHTFKRPLMALGNEWSGNFTLVWQGPEGYEKPLSVGDKGRLVTWIAQRFADIDQQVKPLASTVFTSQLAARVKIFQTENNIQADGIVGLQTLLKINDTLNIGISLTSEQDTIEPAVGTDDFNTDLEHRDQSNTHTPPAIEG